MYFEQFTAFKTVQVRATYKQEAHCQNHLHEFSNLFKIMVFPIKVVWDTSVLLRIIYQN